MPDEHPAASTISHGRGRYEHHLRTPVVTISPSVPVDRAAQWLPLSMERVNIVPQHVQTLTAAPRQLNVIVGQIGRPPSFPIDE